MEPGTAARAGPDKSVEQTCTAAQCDQTGVEPCIVALEVHDRSVVSTGIAAELELDGCVGLVAQKAQPEPHAGIVAQEPCIDAEPDIAPSGDSGNLDH